MLSHVDECNMTNILLVSRFLRFNCKTREMSKTFVNIARGNWAVTSLSLTHKNMQRMGCKRNTLQDKVYDQIYSPVSIYIWSIGDTLVLLQKTSLYVMLCEKLVPYVQFKKGEKYPLGSVTFGKGAAFRLQFY